MPCAKALVWHAKRNKIRYFILQLLPFPFSFSFPLTRFRFRMFPLNPPTPESTRSQSSILKCFEECWTSVDLKWKNIFLAFNKHHVNLSARTWPSTIATAIYSMVYIYSVWRNAHFKSGVLFRFPLNFWSGVRGTRLVLGLIYIESMLAGQWIMSYTALELQLQQCVWKSIKFSCRPGAVSHWHWVYDIKYLL